MLTGTTGRLRVRGVRLRGPRGTELVHCDAVLMSGGWTPSVHLFSQSRGKLRFDESLGAFVPDRSAARERSAGGCAGVFGLDDVHRPGHRGG